MQLLEQNAENRKTIAVMNRISNIKDPPQKDPFPNREKSRKVCRTFQLAPNKYIRNYHSLASETWDARHLDRLVKAAGSPDSLASKLKHTLELKQFPVQNQSKNVCKYGYSNVFPLIESERTSNIGLSNYFSACLIDSKVPSKEAMRQQNQLLSPKERFLKLKELKNQMDEYKKTHSLKLREKRLQQLLKCSYRHGVSGYENPESPEKDFSEQLYQQLTLNQKKKLRSRKDYDAFVKSSLFETGTILNNTHNNVYELSPNMKHKRRAPSVSNGCTLEVVTPRQSVRLFSHVNRPYNILNNTRLK